MENEPSLLLLDGQKSGELESLIKLFTQLTGETPTPQEIESCRKLLAEAE